MAIIDMVGARVLNTLSDESPIQRTGVLAQIVELLHREFRSDAWTWYRQHQDDELLTFREKVLGVFWVSITIRVRHARRLFVQLAGPEPLSDGGAL